MVKRYITTFILAAILAVNALAALTTVNPTANESPDSGQGGSAVTTPTNTGHAASSASAVDGSDESRTCRWSSFTSVSGPILAITLKIDHTSSGALSGAGASNLFRLQYSLNGGSNWTTAVERINYTASQGPTTFSVGLSAGQAISQIQVRDIISADTNDPGETADATATIANIKLEITTQDAQVVVIN